MGFFSRKSRLQRLRDKEDKLHGKIITRASKMEELSKIRSLELNIQKKEAAITAQKRAAFQHSTTGRVLSRMGKGAARMGRGAIATHRGLQKLAKNHAEHMEKMRKSGRTQTNLFGQPQRNRPQQSKRFRGQDKTIEIDGITIKVKGKAPPKTGRRRPTQKQRGRIW